MPHHKSTIKRLRQNRRQNAYNRGVRTRVRHLISRVRKAEGDDASAVLPTAYSVIDRAVQKGVMKKRWAARIKGRLARHAARSQSPQS